MKRIMILTGIIAGMSGNLYATSITNKSDVEQVLNLGVDGGKAQAGSIRLSSKTNTSKAIVTNDAKVKNTLNLAVGQNSAANAGTLSVKNATVNGQVTNKANVSEMLNLAVDGGKANAGTIDINGGSLQGNVTNDSKVKTSLNLAVGKGSVSNLGSVSLENTKLKGGSITNKADVQNMLNLSVDGGKANVGSVDLKGAEVVSAVTNDSKTKNSLNLAVGKGSEASMGSITDGE